MRKTKFNKGITLIALVITIIVLLILAGVTIATLTGDNGILTKANTAKEQTKEATALEKVKIAVMGSYGVDEKIDEKELEKSLKNVEGLTGTVPTKIPATVTVDGYQIDIDINGKVTLSGETIKIPAVPGEIVTGESREYTKNGTAVIPVGFAIVPGLDDISKGLVISDVENDVNKEGNQFVWIPVTSESEYVINKNYADINVSTTVYDDTGYLPDGITDEKETVLKTGGFYIASYEAGKEDEVDKIVSKQGATIWDNISYEDARIQAKTFIHNNNVKSAMISGRQWDATMAFINGKTDGMGKSYNVQQVSDARHIGKLTTAGQNEADCVCNIYDLEGNAFEYDAEKNTYDGEYGSYVTRGGAYNHKAPSAQHDGDTGIARDVIGFRFVLYVIE